MSSSSADDRVPAIPAGVAKLVAHQSWSKIGLRRWAHRDR
jgi:hypothetical protein